jgi:hypothetical protein
MSCCIHCGDVVVYRKIYWQGMQIVACTRCFPLEAVIQSEMFDVQNLSECRGDSYTRFLSTFRRCVIVTYTETLAASSTAAYPRTFLQNDVFLVDIPASITSAGLSPLEFIYMDHCMKDCRDIEGGTQLRLTGYHDAVRWALKVVLQFLGMCGPDSAIPPGIRYVKLVCPKRSHCGPFVFRQSVCVPAEATVISTVIVERVK